jgi:hypothetical protein
MKIEPSREAAHRNQREDKGVYDLQNIAWRFCIVSMLLRSMAFRKGYNNASISKMG